jgi:WD40 repeat protein
MIRNKISFSYLIIIGVLISSEGGNLHCWSLYGERRDMGMFYGSSAPGESILAMCTDATNRHLICGDTRGEIRVWNIEDFCCSTKSPVLFDSKTPPLVQSWQAHISPIIFCEWTNYKEPGNFILTASTDHTARLWTMKGEEIGIFGQRQQWDIELLLSLRGTNDNNEQKQEKTENHINGNEQNGLGK